MRPALLTRILAAMLLVTAAVVYALRTHGGARPASIVVFTVDTLRADALGCERGVPAESSPTPLADRLFARGVRFARAFVPRGQTHPSLASMLTGLYPATHGLRDNGLDYAIPVEPLPVLLRRAGYRTAAFAANLDRTRWPFWIRGFDVAADGVRGRLREEGFGQSYRFQRAWDDRVLEDAARWIDELPDDDTPYFLWVHLCDVHDPYTPADEDAAPFVSRLGEPAVEGPLAHPTGAPGEEPHDAITPILQRSALEYGTPGAELAAAELARVRAFYDGGARGCDRKLAFLHDRLAARGLLDGAIVVYAADHGEELGEHAGYFGHGCSIRDTVLRVPLVIAGAGVRGEGRVIESLAMNLDLYPTLLRFAGVEVPESCEGFDLGPLLRGETPAAPRTRVYAEWEDLVATISDGAWKYLHDPGGFRPRKPPYHLRPGAAYPLPCFGLYDVTRDPFELRDLRAMEPERAGALRAELEAFLAAPRHRLPLVLPDEADPDLAALGYVGSTKRRDVLRVPCGDER